MNINAIIEQVTGEKGSYFVLCRDKIAEIVQRCMDDNSKIRKPVDAPGNEYQKGFKDGFEKGEKVGYAKRSDELYEKAIIENFNLYIDRPDPED